MMVRVAQWCECTSCHRNVQLNMVKTVCVILRDFYHNEKKIFLSIQTLLPTPGHSSWNLLMKRHSLSKQKRLHPLLAPSVLS